MAERDRPVIVMAPAAPTFPLVRGVSREKAATYIDLSPSKFDQLVADGRMPKPIKIDGRNIWDIRALDRAFDALAAVNDDADANSWDDVV
jgi:hypothetical protein